MGFYNKCIPEACERQLCLVKDLKKMYGSPPHNLCGCRPYRVNQFYPCCGPSDVIYCVYHISMWLVNWKWNISKMGIVLTKHNGLWHGYAAYAAIQLTQDCSMISIYTVHLHAMHYDQMHNNQNTNVISASMLVI